MYHPFDTKLAKEDPSLNVCDFYLFEGAPGTTVMAMSVNPDLGLSAPDVLHPEGLYAFRFDLNGDAREEVTFKFRLGEPHHADSDEHTHIQGFQVRIGTGEEALRGAAGDLLLEGETGKVETKSACVPTSASHRNSSRATPLRSTTSWQLFTTNTGSTATRSCIGKTSSPNGI